MNTNVFNAIFFSFLITSVIGCILKLTSMCYKSRCSSVEFCGIKIIRDTALEEKLDEFELTHPKIPQSPSNRNLEI